MSGSHSTESTEIDSLTAAVAQQLEPPSAPPGSTPLHAGGTIGRYRLLRELGRGGMGTVWEAEHTVSHRRVALKLVRNALFLTPRLRMRFAREARLATSVDHPGVVRVHDVFETESGIPVMVMDLLRGETLGDRLRREQRLDVRETCRMLEAVVTTVRAAHRAGVVHRDLKPDNVFLCDGSTDASAVRVLDFGIAKLSAAAADAVSEQSLTETGNLVGTPPYMAPEQLYGEPDIDERADVWALGVMLYECLAGERPIPGNNVGQIVRELGRLRLTALSQRRPEISADLSRTVDLMLRVEPARRLSDLAQVGATLRAEMEPRGSRAGARARALAVVATTAALLLVPLLWRAEPTQAADVAADGPRSPPRPQSKPSAPPPPASVSLSLAPQVPRHSAWGKVIEVLRRSVEQRTSGHVALDLRWSGTNQLYGGDSAILRRMRTGQLDGALLDARSLGKIVPDVMALQLPGFVTSWTKVDWVREHLRRPLGRELGEHGYELLALSDSGCARVMSRGRDVRRPDDLRRRRIGIMSDDAVTPTLLSAVSGSVPIALQMSGVAGALEEASRQSVTSVLATAAAARRHHWSRWLDRVTAMPITCEGGGLVVSESALSKLTADDRAAVSDLAQRLEPEGNALARRADTEASLQLQRDLRVVALTDADRAAWRRVFDLAASRYAQGTLSADRVSEVRRLCGEIDALR